MKQHAQEKLLFATLCFCLLVSSPWQTNAQTQQDKQSRGSDPIVDIGRPQSDRVLPELRARRGKRYNVGQGRPLQEPSRAEESEGTAEPFPAMQALPVKESDSIVIGTVTEVTAHLSQFRDFVYTEFLINPERIMKTSSRSPVTLGQRIEVERAGGAVRFPSGKIRHLRISRDGFPQAGLRYVFFLREQPETNDYYLLTAYELMDGKVEPLDGDGQRRGPGSQFTQYQDADADAFLGKIWEQSGPQHKLGLGTMPNHQRPHRFGFFRRTAQHD